MFHPGTCANRRLLLCARSKSLFKTEWSLGSCRRGLQSSGFAGSEREEQKLEQLETPGLVAIGLSEFATLTQCDAQVE